MKAFRLLNMDEIEVRVQKVHEKSIQLLLYKDARCDQNILDETVGSMNWQKSYELINGSIACTISIWDEEKGRWISKQDVGNESNMEAVKGAYSDAQKRAAFAWGIGRELYTSPQMFFPIAKTGTEKGKCYDKFILTDLEYIDHRIASVTVKDKDTGYAVTFSNDVEAKKPKEDPAITDAKFRADVIAQINKKDKEVVKKIAEYYNVESIADMTTEQFKDFMNKENRK